MTKKTITDRLLGIWNNYDNAKGKVALEMKNIGEIYKNSCARIAQII